MNHNDKFIGQLEDYLETFDGMTPLPDRVRDAVRAELPSARQVQPRTGLLRIFTMPSNTSVGARAGLAAAAIVAVVLVGAVFLNNRGTSPAVGAAATATPTATAAPTTAPTTTTPTPAPSVAPSVAAQPPTLDAGSAVACDPTDTGKSCLAAGTYQLNGGPSVWPVKVTVDVPAGWFNWDGGTGWDALLVQGGPDTHYGGSGWGIGFTTVGDVFRDPCDPSKGTIPASQVNTAQKLAAAISAWRGFTATATKPITVDGHSGLEFTLASKSTTPVCGSSDGSAGFSWYTASNGSVDAYPFVAGRRYPTTIRIIDTGRGLLTVRAMDFPATSPFELSGGVADSATRHVADQVKLHAILDSIHLTNWPASP